MLARPIDTPKVALVAGASAGVGKAFCRALHEAGYRVYGTSRTAKSEQWPMLQMELRSPESVQACVEDVLRQEGRLDVLVTGAGRYIAGAMEETGDGDILEMRDLYLLGAWRMIRAALPAMRAQASGRIVCMNSAASEVAIPFHSAYSASKRAVEAMAESLRFEASPFGIHVSTIQATGIRGTDALAAMGRTDLSIGAYDLPRETAIHRFAGSQLTGISTDKVAETLMRILAAKQPRLHYRIGAARMMPVFRTLLPERMFHSAIARSFLAADPSASAKSAA